MDVPVKRRVVLRSISNERKRPSTGTGTPKRATSATDFIKTGKKKSSDRSFSGDRGKNIKDVSKNKEKKFNNRLDALERM